MKSRWPLPRGFWSALLSAALVMPLFAAAALAQTGPGSQEGRKAFAGKRSPEERRSFFEAWKAQHGSAPGGKTEASIAAIGTGNVGRASMVINGAGTVVHTKNFLGIAPGTTTSCEVDISSPNDWLGSQSYALNDNIRPVAFSSIFMATNAGTTGAVQPNWATASAFGQTIVDGTITWVNTDGVQPSWITGRAYQVGMVVRQGGGSVRGFNYRATTAGTSGATEPVWPTIPGGTVNDNGITWQAIGFYPGSFTGCGPMQLISRASNSVETIIASEGDAVGASQLSGWGEFIAMNASGVVAFRAAVAGLLSDDDENGSGIFTAGPGGGALTKISTSGDTVGGRGVCGHSTMVGMNDAGQVLFDGLGRRHEEVWQPSHVFANQRTYPTVPNGLEFLGTAGTSGAVEPVWPTTPGRTVVDGTITWTGFAQNCDEDDHGLVRNTGGVNSLLVAQGSSVGGSTVIGFGSDDDSQAVGNCAGCSYNDIDGLINSAGHVAVVLNLLDGTQGAFNFTGPGVSTQVARTGVAGVTAIGPRVSINNSDQVVYRATTGGVDRLFRFTPPATTVTIASVGDTVNGHTIFRINAFTDINTSGNVVFQANIDGGAQDAFYYWDGASTQVTLGPIDTLASEMITVNDSNLVAYVTGSGSQEGDTYEGHETGGIFFWTKAGGSTTAIAVGDIIGGDTVGNIYAQHTSFVRRQLSSAGCVATAYSVGTDDPEMDCQEGDNSSGCYANGSPKLFVSCGAVCPVITLAPPTLPGATQGQPYSQSIVASGGAAPYTYAVTTGALPAGLTLSAGGLLSGTPTVTGTFPFTVTATDANACTGLLAYSLVVGGPAQVTILINPPSRTVVVGANSNLTVSINIPQATDTIVTLVSANPAIVSVPPTVTILANQTSATFTVTGVTIGGPVTVTASLPPSFQAPPATTAITVIAVPVATIPTLSGWALALLGVMLAAAAILLMRR